VQRITAGEDDMEDTLMGEAMEMGIQVETVDFQAVIVDFHRVVVWAVEEILVEEGWVVLVEGVGVQVVVVEEEVDDVEVACRVGWSSSKSPDWLFL
jgi:hypothetical protein